MTRAETRCGCFLPDLTGLARRPSAADLPPLDIIDPARGKHSWRTLGSAVSPVQANGSPRACPHWQGPRLRRECVVTLSSPAARCYTGSPLDRAAERDDEAWIAAALAHPDTLFAPVWRSRACCAAYRGPARGGVPPARRPRHARPMASRRPLGFPRPEARPPVFAVDLGAAEDPPPLLPPDMASLPICARWPACSAHDAAMLAHARGLMHWRGRHRFCGVCGAACAPRSAGHVMHCPAAAPSISRAPTRP